MGASRIAAVIKKSGAEEFAYESLKGSSHQDGSTYFFFKKMPVAKTAPSFAAVEQYGSISVTTKMAGTITVDGTEMGVLPASSTAMIDNLSIGEHSVSILYSVADGKNEEVKVKVAPNSVSPVLFTHITEKLQPVMSEARPTENTDELQDSISQMEEVPETTSLPETELIAESDINVASTENGAVEADSVEAVPEQADSKKQIKEPKVYKFSWLDPLLGIGSYKQKDYLNGFFISAGETGLSIVAYGIANRIDWIKQAAEYGIKEEYIDFTLPNNYI